MKLILELSGEHPNIPLEEVKAIIPVYDQNTQVLIVDAPDLNILERFAYTHAAMRFLGECAADKESFVRMLTDMAITSSEPFCGRVKKMVDHGMDTPSADLERLIGFYVNGPVSVSTPTRVLEPSYLVEDATLVNCSGNLTEIPITAENQEIAHSFIRA
ncbi:hypothetical protein [Methanospirillum purgamenti]|uniref:hypothetical protein n=1 Tax=Methanospirillum purgamenti TaxID=2834276 RepID=UPI002115A3C3|nr:hypothetical protein [Methanospirillum hungatei]